MPAARDWRVPAPRPLQDVPAGDLVVERVEASPRVGLGRPVERSLQFSDSVLLGGASHEGTHQPFPARETRGRSSGPSHHRRLCCPTGSSGTTAASDALPAGRPLHGSSPLIGRPAPAVVPAARRAGEGLPSSRRHLLSVPRPLRREVLRGCASRLFTPSMAFALRDWARLFLAPALRRATLTARQASLHAADRSVAPPEGLSTLGFDPARFQTEPPACYRASWQLPGPDSHRLATTSLCSDQVTRSNHLRNAGRTVG